MPTLPDLETLVPSLDHHAWPFVKTNGYRTHVRLRVWPATNGSNLAIATDLLLGGGHLPDSLHRAVTEQFGHGTTVIRHLPARIPTAGDRDKFEVLVPDRGGKVRSAACTEEILRLLGPGVLGFPGDPLPSTDTPAVPPQSAQLVRLLGAALRLHKAAKTLADVPDLDRISQVSLSLMGLEHLAHFVSEIVVDEHRTAAGARREKKLAQITEVLHLQAQELRYLCDDLETEEREQAN